jgi:hypothetical protein
MCVLIIGESGPETGPFLVLIEAYPALTRRRGIRQRYTLGVSGRRLKGGLWPEGGSNRVTSCLAYQARDIIFSHN